MGFEPGKKWKHYCGAEIIAGGQRHDDSDISVHHAHCRMCRSDADALFWKIVYPADQQNQLPTARLGCHRFCRGAGFCIDKMAGPAGVNNEHGDRIDTCNNKGNENACNGMLIVAGGAVFFDGLISTHLLPHLG